MQTICYQRGTILSEEIKNKIKNKIFNQINNEHEFNKITTELKLKYADAERLQRNEKPSKKLNKDIKSLEENIVKNVKTTQKNKTELYLQMNKLYHDFWSDDPTQAIETFNAKTPIILFPIRLEIKYRLKDDGSYWLLVRIFPDNIAIQTHESDITLEELDRLREYHDKISSLRSEPDDDKRIQSEKEAYNILFGEFGSYRTSYLLQIDATSLDNEMYTIGGKEINLRPDSWSEPPKSYMMPDKFVIKLFRGDSMINEKYGNIIPTPLIVGPSPKEIPEIEEIPTPNDDGNCPDGWHLSEDETSCEKDEYVLDADSEWLFDFTKAEKIGMAVQIQLSVDDEKKGFTKIIALGIKASTNEQTSTTLLTELMKNHEFTNGCSLLKIGTPTNNTNETQSDFSSHGLDHDKAYKLNNIQYNDYHKKDGYRLENAFGLNKNTFLHLENAGKCDDLDSEHMQNALWHATLGYYLKYMFNGSINHVIRDKYINAFKKHFLKFVRARGPYSSIKIGSMPYGILPITAFDKWENDLQDSPISKNCSDFDYDVKFNILFLKLLRIFWSKWEDMAKNKKNISYIGAYNDVERELVSILGMNAVSTTCKIRNVVSDHYIWNLLQFGSPLLFNTRFTNAIFPFSIAVPRLGRLHTSYNAISAWYEIMIKNHEKTKEILEEIGFSKKQKHPITSIQYWNNSRYMKPRVYDDNTSKTKPLPKISGSEMNYIQWLECGFDSSIKENNEQFNPNSILYDLLKFSILVSNTTERTSLSHLQTISIQSLEYLLSETLDLCTSRFDAFVTSLPHKRLQSIRKSGHQGIQIGAYGWLENIPPYSDKSTKGGFIHAPSISHAATAGILRNAYLTHANQDENNAMSINFSSDRVRRALWLLDAIREGQPLAALLGYQFERGLHENYLNLELDEYIHFLRKLYPLAQNETEIDSTGSEDSISARNVVDGLKLLTAWKDNNLFSQLHANVQNRNAIMNEIKLLDDSLDAIGDLALTESVFQSVEGNHDKAGALIEALSGGGTLPEPDVVKTLRSSISQEYKVMMLFDAPSDEDAPSDDNSVTQFWKLTPRAEMEPSLNQLAENILGDLGKIKCVIKYDDKNEELTLEDIFCKDYMRIAPLDFILMMTTLSKSEEAESMTLNSPEIEQRISYCIRHKYKLDKDKEIKIQFQHDQTSKSPSFQNLLEIAKKMLDVIGNSTPVQSEDLHLPEEFEETINEEIERDSPLDKFRQNLSSIVGSDDLELVDTDSEQLLTLKTQLLGDINNINIASRDYSINLEKIRATLYKISRFGIAEAIPYSATDEDTDTVDDDLIRRGQTVIVEIDKRYNEYKKNVEKIDDKNFTISEKNSFLINATKAIFGKSFVIMPKIILKNKNELDRAFNGFSAEKNTGKVWLQQASRTHKKLQQFETFAMYVKAITNTINFDPKIVQLPYKEDAPWMGLPFEDNNEKRQGTVSIVAFNLNNNILHNGGNPFKEEICGMLLDRWVEMIPKKEVTTGLTYHFDQPNSEPPQNILLSISPKLNDGKWKWSNLEESILDTLKLAKMRAVDYNALQGMGDIFPALFLPTNPVATNSMPKVIPIGFSPTKTNDEEMD